MHRTSTTSIRRALAAATLGAAYALSAPAGAETVFKIQTSTQAGGATFTYMSKQWLPRLEAMTGGEVRVELLPIRSVVPHRETPDAVAAGVLDGDLTSIAYFSGRNPAFAILGDLIAGYDTPEQVQTYCRFGGGREALQALYDKILPGKIHVIGCGPLSREALVSTIPIRGVDDLQGIKIRSPEGMAAAVFKKAGAEPVAMPIGDLFTSLEQGVVVAADASAYVNNVRNGYHQIARYPIFPGIHSQAVHQLTVNKSKWDSLTDEQKLVMETWYNAMYDDIRRHLHLKDLELVAKDKADPKITVIDWPQSERDRFRALAREAWEEMAARSPEARAALASQLTFMKTIGLLE